MICQYFQESVRSHVCGRNVGRDSRDLMSLHVTTEHTQVNIILIHSAIMVVFLLNGSIVECSVTLLIRENSSTSVTCRKNASFKVLLLSYQKKDLRAGPHQSLIWYDTNFTIPVNSTGYKSIVVVIQKEGFFGYDTNKNL